MPVVDINKEAVSAEPSSANKSQVCVFLSPLMDWKVDYVSNIIILRTLQSNAAMLLHSSPKPQVCLRVFSIITCWTRTLKLHVMLMCFAGTCPRRLPASGV